jgi:hypothetical protein
MIMRARLAARRASGAIGMAAWMKDGDEAT